MILVFSSLGSMFNKPVSMADGGVDPLTSSGFHLSRNGYGRTHTHTRTQAPTTGAAGARRRHGVLLELVDEVEEGVARPQQLRGPRLFRHTPGRHPMRQPPRRAATRTPLVARRGPMRGHDKAWLACRAKRGGLLRAPVRTSTEFLRQPLHNTPSTARMVGMPCRLAMATMTRHRRAAGPIAPRRRDTDTRPFNATAVS